MLVWTFLRQKQCLVKMNRYPNCTTVSNLRLTRLEMRVCVAVAVPSIYYTLLRSSTWRIDGIFKSFILYIVRIGKRKIVFYFIRPDISHIRLSSFRREFITVRPPSNLIYYSQKARALSNGSCARTHFSSYHLHSNEIDCTRIRWIYAIYHDVIVYILVIYNISSSVLMIYTYNIQ